MSTNTILNQTWAALIEKWRSSGLSAKVAVHLYDDDCCTIDFAFCKYGLPFNCASIDLFMGYYKLFNRSTIANTSAIRSKRCS